MVYVETEIRDGNEYHRLVYTIREDNKVVHKRKYIGTSLPSKEKLKKIKDGFLEAVKEGKSRYLSVKDIKAVEVKKKNYNQDISKLSVLEKEKQLKEFMIRFTYDSSKLSGVDITLRQTFLILKEGVAPANVKSLKTIKAVENHQKGVVAITQYKGTFNLRFIKKLHSILLSGIDDFIAGKTRDELKKNVKLAGTPYVPPPWQEVKKELENFFKWYKFESRKLHPLELAALIHLKIISMQVFVDGNSRLSRLLMNWILWKKGYPPIDIPIEELENYYKNLDLYQIEKKEKPFVEYILKRYLKSK